MSCIRPLWLRDKGILAPCGQCPSCRAKRATSWSVRLAHEVAYHERSCFVTLTINDSHMPPNGSLEKKRLQKFFKRLRKSLCDRKIKYYACGEYGEKSLRAHYHAIIFGLGIKDKELIESAWTEDGEPIGIVDVGLCEIKSIHYVCGYVRKKMDGWKNYEYKRLGFEPPFSLQSQGLGLRFAQDHYEHLLTNKTVRLNGLVTGLPRYYCDKLGVDPRELRIDAEERSEKEVYELLDRHIDKLTQADVDYYTSELHLNLETPAYSESWRKRLHDLKMQLSLYRQKSLTLNSQKGLKKSGVF